MKILNSFANNDAKNITRTRRKLASIDTARFVDEYLYDVPVFEDRYKLISFALKEVKFDGLYLEFGVYKAKTINFVADILPSVTLYGFDSFEGLPENWRHDFTKGAFALERLPAVRNNVRLVKGWFNETLPEFVKEHTQPCAFVHVDCDLYSSTKTVFEALNRQLVKGTVLVFDEFFNYPGWRNGEYKALMELCEKHGFEIQYLGYCDRDEQVAIRLK